MTKKTFKEFYSNTQEKDLDEFRVLSKAARKKMAIRMKKLAKSAAFKTKVARSKFKVADPAKLLVKARKAAKKKFVDKLFPSYKEFSLQRRVQADQIINQKYGGAITKIAKRMQNVLRKKEKDKVKAARAAKQDKS